MARNTFTVVISQGQSKNPAQRRLEEQLALSLAEIDGVQVSLVPHLYDLTGDHSGLQFLKAIPGDLAVLAWLYPRASRWVLDRQGIRGQEGESLLVEEADDDAEAEDKEYPDAIGSIEVPDRKIYCIDLRVSAEPDAYVEEIKRIIQSSARIEELTSWIQGHPQKEQLERYLAPRPGDADFAVPSPQDEAPPRRRWYPVIDYSRCTNCMECIDFCLFGVYGLDHQERILVESQDQCKKGCPACSRVCPENAIIFPQHKTPAIAGAEGEIAGLKIDLSVLFGGGSGKNALELAVAERDIELLRDGRDAVGMSVGIPRRQTNRENGPRDDLDRLMDQFDALDF